jgi:hypothetical protein
MHDGYALLIGQVGDNAGALIVLVVLLAIVIGIIASLWKLYEKAGESGWTCLVPIYNIIVLLRIAGRPGWWLLLWFVPVINWVIPIIVWLDVANKFGKGFLFGLGLVFFPVIFIPILAFGSAEYGESGVTRTAKAAKSGKKMKAGTTAAEDLEKRVSFIQEYIKLWRQFFETFAEGFEGRKIYKKDEEEFSRILNSLAHHHYRFTATVHPEMGGTGEIIKILCDAISLSHLKTLSEAQISKIQIEWHTLFIKMNKALGRWIAKRPLTPEEEELKKRGGPPPEPAPSRQPQPGAPS